MLTRGLTTLTAGFATIALFAGCSEQSSGDPGPTLGSPAGESQSPGSGLPDSGAPKVENPIDTARFEAKPCSVASRAQLKKAGYEFDDAEPRPGNSTGSECKWTFAESGQGIVAGTFVTLGGRGLSDLYDQRDTSYRALFEEVPSVAGYPAVIYNTVDARPSGLCTVSVGVRDDLTYEIAASLISGHPNYADSCKVALEIAEIAVETMKKGQS